MAKRTRKAPPSTPLTIHIKRPQSHPTDQQPSPPPPTSPPPREPSPEWKCEQNSLPADDVEGTQSSEDSPPSSQSQNARSPRWLPWQDRRLVIEVDTFHPFEVSGGAGAHREAWDRLSEQLFEHSSQEGPQSVIQRSGNACRHCFEYLVAMHKQEETQSLQATGTNEEIDDHIKRLTGLVALFDDVAQARKAKSNENAKKRSLEDEASWQMREQSMNGLALSGSMIDIAKLPGASVREKQAQRSNKQQTVALSEDKENILIIPPPRKKRHTVQVESILSDRVTADRKALQDILALDQARHEEMTNLQKQTLDALRGLTDQLQAQQQRDLERQNEELTHCLQEKDQQSALTSAILSLSMNLPQNLKH